MWIRAICVRGNWNNEKRRYDWDIVGGVADSIEHTIRNLRHAQRFDLAKSVFKALEYKFEIQQNDCEHKEYVEKRRRAINIIDGWIQSGKEFLNVTPDTHNILGDIVLSQEIWEQPENNPDIITRITDLIKYYWDSIYNFAQVLISKIAKMIGAKNVRTKR